MKILLLEYVTGGGMRQEAIPPSLAVEGGQMLKALMGDLLAVPDVGLMVLQDDRLPLPQRDRRIQAVSISADAPFEAIWLESIQSCDAVWPIAPETAGILERLCLDVEYAGKALLTSPAAAVRLAASKLATARHLALHGLPVVPTLPLAAITSSKPGVQGLTCTDSPTRASQALHSNAGQRPSLDSAAASAPLWEWENETYPFIIKPDDGVGCEGSRIILNPAEFQTQRETESWIAQPLLEGEALSLSTLFAHGKARLLSVNRQLIEQTGEGFILKGCQVNAIADVDSHWQNLADGVALAIPELWGYAGIDLILGPDGPVILEINPRLTTSYSGLSTATGENPATLILDLLRTGALPPLRGDPGKQIEILLEKPDGH